GWAAHLSPTDGHPPAGCALLFGLAPGGVCPFHSESTARAADRHRHCGTGPRLTAGGRYPPPCAAELGLSSRPRRVTPSTTRDHPTASLTGPILRARPDHHLRRAPALGAIDGLIGELIGDGVAGPGHVRRGPALE